MSESDAYALLERYLSGQMDAREAAAFEAQIQQDPMLARYAREFEEITGHLLRFGQRQSLKAKLNNIHTAEIVPLPEKQPRFRVFWNTYATTMAVAASVAILTVFSTLFSMELWRSLGKKTNSNYIELRREVDRIKKSQRAIIKGINQTVPKTESRSNVFTGTGFALTSNGYIVTSFHVVNDADSIYIENSTGNRYKVTEIYKDAEHDLAILKVSDPAFKSFGALPYGVAASSADLGEKVYTLGYPREDMVFGEGSLSSQSGFEGDTVAYQISVPLNPGNSGGPLFDEKGNLIGVISGKQIDQQGAAFATKSSYLISLADQLETDSAFKASFIKHSVGVNRPRKQQLKKLKDFIFMVKVYN